MCRGFFWNWAKVHVISCAAHKRRESLALVLNAALLPVWFSVLLIIFRAKIIHLCKHFAWPNIGNLKIRKKKIVYLVCSPAETFIYCKSMWLDCHIRCSTKKNVQSVLSASVWSIKKIRAAANKSVLVFAGVNFISHMGSEIFLDFILFCSAKSPLN